jgi:hypothetical protein
MEKEKELSDEKAAKQQMQIRMDDQMKRRVREYMKQFEKKTHAKIAFSEAVRMLVTRSLEREGIR